MVKKGQAQHLCGACRPNAYFSDTNAFLEHQRKAHGSKVFFQDISKKLQDKSLALCYKIMTKSYQNVHEIFNVEKIDRKRQHEQNNMILNQLTIAQCPTCGIVQESNYILYFHLEYACDDEKASEDYISFYQNALSFTPEEMEALKAAEEESKYISNLFLSF